MKKFSCPWSKENSERRYGFWQTSDASRGAREDSEAGISLIRLTPHSLKEIRLERRFLVGYQESSICPDLLLNIALKRQH